MHQHTSMSKNSVHPIIFEINTGVWVSGLSRKYRSSVNLESVPEQEWDAIAGLGFDAVWLMGVWERSPAGIAIANRNQGLMDDFRRALPDFSLRDNVGSPYCVRSYVVDSYFGGRRGLETARKELAKRGMGLILDFVPNHMAPDNPWVGEHPEYFIPVSADDSRKDPSSCIPCGGSFLACGRDPYFPAWPDVLQLNAFQPALRLAVRDTVLDIASQCDGIRCDMAMLMLNAIFERTWGSRAGQQPATEYWADLIPAIKTAHPGFLFIAEVYWDLGWVLQQKGFDFCYDKQLYDRLENGSTESIRLHLCADLAYQDKLIRFIENHDEPRAAATFPPAKERAAAVTMATVPGARLFHEGQFEGRKVKLPVFLGRRPEEPADEDLCTFYRKLLGAIKSPAFGDGKWRLCGRTGWPNNQSFQNLLAWSWTSKDNRYLIVVNYSGDAVQARVQLPWSDMGGDPWRLIDSLSGVSYDRDGNELQTVGLYVALEPWNFHFLECHRRSLTDA